MAENDNQKFDINNVKPVELNLLNGQVELILRGLELYGYNLEFMLDSSDASAETRQDKIALIKYTYEQILSTQAEQVNGKSDNIDNLNSLGKILLNDHKLTKIKDEKKFKVL